jgi:hypothetical protein
MTGLRSVSTLFVDAISERRPKLNLTRHGPHAVCRRPIHVHESRADLDGHVIEPQFATLFKALLCQSSAHARVARMFLNSHRHRVHRIAMHHPTKFEA